MTANYLNTLQERVSNTKITDMNFDCLVDIFDYLSIGDFLNLADSSKYLKSAVESLFIRRYRKKCFHLYHLFNTWEQHIIVEADVLVEDLRSGLQLLRCFGHLIHRLRIANLSDIKYGYIVAYTNEYCISSLFEVHLLAIPISASKLLEPYTSVESLTMYNSHLDGIHLHEIFPNLKSLCYCGYDYKVLENHFTNLETLVILADWEKKSDMEKENIGNALRLNPQLRSLKAPYKSDAKFIRLVAENLRKLQHFDITWDQKDFLNYGAMTFHFEHMKKLDFQLNLDGLQRDPLLKIPFIFNQLEELVSMGLSFNDDFFEFLTRNPSILKLTFLRPSNLSKLNISKLVTALPNLNEVSFKFCLENSQIEETICCMEEIKSLKRCNFQTYLNNDKCLFYCLEKKWKASIHDYLMDIKKIVFDRRF